MYLDPNLALIISNAVAKIKSKQLKKPAKRKRPCKYPCSVCEKNVNANQKGIKCDKCQLWSHASCNGISKSEYGELVEEDDDVPWYCMPCLVLKSAEIFPFGLFSKTELCELLEVELPSQIESLPSFEIVSKLSNLPNLNSFDIDENLFQTKNSKY